MIKLIEPIKELENEIFEYKKEMIASCDEELNGCGGLDRFSGFEEWLEHLHSYADRNKLDPSSGFVEGRQYLLVDDEKRRVLGMVNVRHYLSPFLYQVGGHIGFSVRPSERRRGYGKLQLLLALEKLKEIDVNKVLVTCSSENIASSKTIEACGGILENELFSDRYNCFIKRYWISI